MSMLPSRRHVGLPMARLWAATQWAFCAVVLIGALALALWPGESRLDQLGRGMDGQSSQRRARHGIPSAPVCARCGSSHVFTEWQTVDEELQLLTPVRKCEDCGYALDMQQQCPVTGERPGLKVLPGRTCCPTCGGSDLVKEWRFLGYRCCQVALSEDARERYGMIVTCMRCGERWAEEVTPRPSLRRSLPSPLRE
jgi:RNA polymerase subunit RPABC4/transcription elongation factor Spt4